MPWLALILVVSEHLRGAPGRAVLDRLGMLALRVALLLTGLHAAIAGLVPGTPVWAKLPTVVAFHWVLVLPALWVSVRWRRSIRRLVVLIAWFPVLLLGMSAVRLPTVVDETPPWLGTGQPFEVTSRDGVQLRGLRFEPARAGPDVRACKGVVVLVHGIGAEKCQFLPAIRPLAELGFEVWTYDQRGHGASDGTICTFGRREAEDLTAVWQRMLERTSGRAGPRIVYGVSLGGAAAQLAAPDLALLDGLVLDSTFAELRAVGARRIPWVGGLAFDALAALRVDVLLLGARALDLRPGDALIGLSRPILVLHAAADPVIPASEPRALEARNRSWSTRIELPGRGHGTGFAHATSRHRRALSRFVERCTGTRGF